MPARPGDRIGSLLVLGQFLCIAALVFGGSWILPHWAQGLFLLGLLVFLWALFSIGRRNLTVMPAPVPGNRLSAHGIYAVVRHPMYLAVLLCGAAVAVAAPTMLRWIALGLLFAVLVLKLRHEERLLTQRHPDYPVVMKGVARLLPGVW